MKVYVRSQIFQEVIDIMAARYRDAKLDSIGGFDARGFVLGAPLALALKVRHETSVHHSGEGGMSAVAVEP